MIGCRPLKPEEVTLIADALPSERDRVLFLLGVYTGFRIQELLSIKKNQLLSPQGYLVSRLSVARGNMKGKRSSRSVILHPALTSILQSFLEGKNQDEFLFPIGRMQVWRILNTTVRRLEAEGKIKIDGRIATHSMRKTFADKVYKATDGDLVLTSKALGHTQINNTALYLSFCSEDVDAAILSE